MSDNSCPIGCQDPTHMHECPNCGARYHFGLTHCCPTSMPMLQLMEKPKPIDKPVMLTTPFYTIPPEEEPYQDWTMWEDEEDTLRKRKHKSIRTQGKYKGRGKTKRREA